MQTSQDQLAKTYQACSDDDLASLFAQIGSLTEAAHRALMAEIERRGLKDADLARMQARETRSEQNFDRQERIRRKGVISYLLFRNDPKGTIAVLVIAVVVLLLSVLFARHR